MVTIRNPVQSPASEIKNPVKRFPRSGVGVEHQKARETGRIGWAENQVPVTSQDAYMVGVLVIGMLPASLAEGANQNQSAGVDVRRAGVRLVRILVRVVRIHQIRHGTAIDQ